jgi:ABC-type transport system involved in cytochrome c biogenesis permease subunit
MSQAPGPKGLPGIPLAGWLVSGAVVGALSFMIVAMSYRSSSYDLEKFGQLPIQSGGRLKPFDTLARTSLQVITHRTEFTDTEGRSRPATEWLLDVMTSRLSDKGRAESLKIFRVENDQVLRLLGLERRQGLRYAISEFRDKMADIEKAASEAARVEASRRDVYQRQLLELTRHLELYIQIATLTIPETGLIPPDAAAEGESTDRWLTFQEAMVATREGRSNPATEAFGRILLSYAQQKPADFNKHLDNYLDILKERVPGPAIAKVRMEQVYNAVNPIYLSCVLYVCILLATLVGWMMGEKVIAVQRGVLAATIMVACIHSAALLMRMYLQGRPPVTNLYSSAVFIGWGCAWLGVALEWLDKRGAGNAIAAVTGFLSLLIAQFLGASGDTLEMLQAVLDTNFWLATHVTCITLGYTASFVAGFLAIGYVLWGVCTPWMSAEGGKALIKKTYGVVCFATLLSFVGTVLGGIWADQSWGRFWGWDPKENGALLIVLWNALILHARWGGMVRDRGVAVLAILGNIITAWSWFGTNQLSVGLHAYGFDQTLARSLRITWIAHLVLAAIAMLPERCWWSLRPKMEPAPVVSGKLAVARRR